MKFLVLLVGALTLGAHGDQWQADLRRARQKVPRAEWLGQGSLASANAQLNKHLAARQGLRLKACEDHTVHELRATLRQLFLKASEMLKSVYPQGDGRHSKYADIAEMEAHWVSHAPADDERVRDAHCHEAVMWFVHHLTSDAQKQSMGDLVLPMLPVTDHVNATRLRGSMDRAGVYYAEKTTCQKCHVTSALDAASKKTVPDSKDLVIVNDAEKPPVFSPRFHVNFSEYTAMMKVLPWQKGGTNTGSLHYDADGRRQVWLHGKGQSDNWCQCAGLKTDEPCTLIAAPSANEAGGGATYVAFKTLKKCCKLGTFEKGFGPLARDWLRDANKTGQLQVGNRSCTTWAGGPPGDWFMMISDDWSVDGKGRPCQYADHFKWWARAFMGMSHSYTFDDASYSEAAEPDEVFAVPDGIGCDQTCPNTAGGWCKSR